MEMMDIPARDPHAVEAAERLYKGNYKDPLSEGVAYSFSYLPLQMANSREEEQELAAIVGKIPQETSSTRTEGLKAQYEIIQRMISDPGEATATVFMTRKQRYTTPSEPAPGNYMTILAMLSYPFSRGSSHITSANSRETPEIKFNYFQHPSDMEILSRHIIQIVQMIKLPVLSAYLKPGSNTLPNGFPR
jgi:propionyl-CoA synthetase